jgi:predicted DNA binding CopG/RHH family protein
MVDDSPAGDEISTDGEQWLRLHATDLIDHLQSWSADLDARESQINLRASMQDHRERQFRLLQQDASAEMAEQQRAIDRLRSEIQTQARRLAFGG